MSSIHAAILAIGSEIVQGHIPDTNSHWLAQRLRHLGVACTQVLALADQPVSIVAEANRLWQSGHSLIVAGGIGPTVDDYTRSAIAEVLGARLLACAATLEHQRLRHQRIGRAFSDGEHPELMIPEGCDALMNDFGSAAGFGRFEDNRFLVVLPGVPRELHGMWQAEVEARLRARYSWLEPTWTRELVTIGATEPRLNSVLEDLLQPRAGIEAAILVDDLEVTLRWQTREKSLRGDVDALCRAAAARVQELVIVERAGEVIERTPADPLAEAVVMQLRNKGMRVACAESCTGGGVAAMLTDVPGSSEVFEFGVVAYANAIKEAVLGVPAQVLKQHGAVSEQCVCAMAHGMCERSGADIAVAVSGIAGPGGASLDKPTGLVWIGLAFADKQAGYRYTFSGDRWLVRRRAARAALDLVRRTLLHGALPESATPECASSARHTEKGLAS